MHLHLIIVGIPVLLVVALSVLIWSRKGPHPASYKLGEKWTHPPILWAAIGEEVGHSHGGARHVGILSRRWRQWHVVR